MKLEIGKEKYPFRHVGEIKGATIKGFKGKDLHLTLLTLDDMKERHKQMKDARAIPVYVAFDQKEQALWFFPTPAAPYEVNVKGSSTITLPKKQ